MADTETPGWWVPVSRDYGDLLGIAFDHPGTGLENALHGNYHPDGGGVHGGLAEWVYDHTPAVVEGTEHITGEGSDEATQRPSG